MLIPKALVAIVWAAVFGLAIGLPLGWGFSQFHPPAIATHHESGSSDAKGSPTYVVKEYESYLDKVVDPVAISTYVLCFVTGWLAWYTRGLFRETRKLARNTQQASAAALTASTDASKALVDMERPYISSSLSALWRRMKREIGAFPTLWPTTAGRQPSLVAQLSAWWAPAAAE
jgi:hypothetical protein